MEKTTSVRLVIDGRQVQVPEGITILEAARRVQVPIPTLCHHPALSAWGGCRLCVVEVDHAPRLVASCVMPVREGMEVVTVNERIRESRRIVLEFLFAERNHHCMICAQSGDCELQQLAYDLQLDHLTVPSSFKNFPVDLSSEYLGIDHNRCILCGRCVRACQEIAGARVLGFHHRGPRTLVGMDLETSREESMCHGCGVCLQVCPTGALYSRYRSHQAVKGHGRNWERRESLCPRCGLLCPTISSVRGAQVLKIEGRLETENGRPGRGQLCRRGRFEPLKSGGRRLTRPLIRQEDGHWSETGWEEALSRIATGLKAADGHSRERGLFGLISPASSNEELLLFRDLMRRGFDSAQVDIFEGQRFRALANSLRQAGEGWREASWPMISAADLILVVGVDLPGRWPFLASLIHRAALEKSVQVAHVGSRSRPLPGASAGLGVDEKSLTAVIRWFAATAGERIGVSGNTRRKKGAAREKRQNRPLDLGLEPQIRQAFSELAEAFARSERPVILAGEALMDAHDPGTPESLLGLAALKKPWCEDRSCLMILKPGGNSSGAWRLGLPSPQEPPDRACGAGLAVLADLSELEGESDRLAGSDFLAVMTAWFPENCPEAVRVLLPRPTWLEAEGTFTSLDGLETAFKPAVVPPPAGVRPTWRSLLALMDLMGVREAGRTWDELRQRAEKEIQGRRWLHE